MLGWHDDAGWRHVQNLHSKEEKRLRRKLFFGALFSGCVMLLVWLFAVLLSLCSLALSVWVVVQVLQYCGVL